MTTLEIWIDASLSTIKDSVNQCQEFLNCKDMNGLKIQFSVLDKQVESYIEYLRRRR
jgi:hypothetical protein